MLNKQANFPLILCSTLVFHAAHVSVPLYYLSRFSAQRLLQALLGANVAYLFLAKEVSLLSKHRLILLKRSDCTYRVCLDPFRTHLVHLLIRIVSSTLYYRKTT